MNFRMRHSAALFALVAILLRAVIPAGWMPDSGAGAPRAFCTADGLVLLHTTDTDPAPSPDEHASLLCPFAVSAGGAAAPAIAVPTANVFAPAKASPARQPRPFYVVVPPGSRLTRAPPV